MKKLRELKEIEGVKGRILDVALDIIVGEGYGNLTMRRLASKLNMTAPNIYNYYKSKDEIYIHLVIRGFNMLNNIIPIAVGGGGIPVVKVIPEVIGDEEIYKGNFDIIYKRSFKPLGEFIAAMLLRNQQLKGRGDRVQDRHQLLVFGSNL